MVNLVILSGYANKVKEFDTKSGKIYTITVYNRVKNQKNYIQVKTFDKRAGSIKNGDLILVQGSYAVDNYKNNFYHYIFANNLQILQSKEDDSDGVFEDSGEVDFEEDDEFNFEE